MSRRAPAVVLSPEERATLQSWAKARSQPQRLVQRAQVVLMAAEGIENQEIAARLRISRPTVQLWRQRFLALRGAGHQLPGVMKLVPPLPGEEALYGWINSVFEAAEKEPETKKALIESFVAADKELIAPLTQWKLNGRSAGNGWTSPVNNAQWGTDYLNRTGTAKSNMYDNKPSETKYIYRDFDSQGQQLHGKNTYTVTFPTTAAGERLLVANAL